MIESQPKEVVVVPVVAVVFNRVDIFVIGLIFIGLVDVILLVLVVLTLKFGKKLDCCCGCC